MHNTQSALQWKYYDFFILRVLPSFHQDDFKHDVHFSLSLKVYLINTLISTRVHSLGFYVFPPKCFYWNKLQPILTCILDSLKILIWNFKASHLHNHYFCRILIKAMEIPGSTLQ